MVVTAQRYRGALGQAVVSDQIASGWETFGENITDIFRTYAEYETAQKCLDINLARAERGEPPLDCAAYGTGVQIGVSPATQNLVLIVVAALAGAYLLPKLLR